MRVDRVPTATSRMSRRRCSTPISSASSASMTDGVCTNVLAVVDPSLIVSAHWGYRGDSGGGGQSYISDLFYGEICICGDSYILWLDVDDDE